jgi:hypothetical protein
MPTLSPDILIAALEGYEQQKNRIDSRIAELRAMLSRTPTESATPSIAATVTRRKRSAAVRKRMSEAQRKRWSGTNGQSVAPVEPAPKEAAKPGRTLSAAGRAAIVAALKKRWAAKKAASQVEKPAVAKKRTARKG